MTHHGTGKARGIVPEGFELERQGKDVFIIRHKRTGMGCMNIFLIVWLVYWTGYCVDLLRQYLSGNRIDLWLVIAFWGGEVVAAVVLVYQLFCKTSFRLDCKNLIMETDVLGLKRRRLIPRTSIRRLVQEKDGGEGEDSFPSWGLRLEGETTATLIFRQPHKKSRWLGQILAEWAGVEFSEVPED
jgi:hypothetical protein